MTTHDWRWKIGEAVERLRVRYRFIGRTTGAPFLALVYPVEAEASVLKEWHTQIAALQPEIDVRSINLLDVTQSIISEIGAEAIVDALAEPMPGSNPEGELGRMWVTAIAEAIQETLRDASQGKPVISIERLAAVYPAAGPRDIMQYLWDGAVDLFDGPVVVLIPGIHHGSRTYSFLGRSKEFMYRGDLL